MVALLEKYPHREGVLLDLPELIPVAKEKNPVSDPSVAARLEYVGASMLDTVPEGDAYVLKHIIHDWDDERSLRILKTAIRACRDRGG